MDWTWWLILVFVIMQLVIDRMRRDKARMRHESNGCRRSREVGHWPKAFRNMEPSPRMRCLVILTRVEKNAPPLPCYGMGSTAA